ncbi:MAG: WXG100 family type VII secretion target [Lachnospiraceae bacterium]|nr:WXG100 family type VII secretion target [Lachnospiraceae bacterium]
MIPYTEVDTARMNQDIRALEQEIANARSGLDKMMQEIEQLNSMWVGKANMAFRVQVAKDQTTMNEVLDEMDRLVDCMTYASSEYAKCESEVRSVVDSIRV